MKRYGTDYVLISSAHNMFLRLRSAHNIFLRVRTEHIRFYAVSINGTDRVVVLR